MLLNEDKYKWGLDSHSPGWTARVVCSGRQGQLTCKSVGPGAWREKGLQALTSKGPNDSRSLLANKGDPSASILDHLSIHWEVEKASCESKLFPGKAARHCNNTEFLNFYPLSPPSTILLRKVIYKPVLYTARLSHPAKVSPGFQNHLTYPASPTCTKSLPQNIKAIIAIQREREHALKFHLTSERVIRLARLVGRGYWNRFSTAREQKRMWK